MHLVDLTMFYPAVTGGVGTYRAAKARWLHAHGPMRHTIVAPVSPRMPPEAHVVPIAGVPLPGSHGYRLPLSMRQARRTVERLQPDLIECGDPYQCAWSGLRASRNLGVPAIAFYHSDLPTLVGQRLGAAARRSAQRYVSSLYSQFDLVLTPSMIMVERLRQLGIGHALRQPLGVDTAVFSPSSAAPALRDALGLPPHARLLVYAGRLTREKRVPLLLEAVRRLGPPYYLLIMGSGGPLPATDRVIRLPFQSRPAALARLMGGCDLLVHTGEQETFGMVVLEAMACGIPVLGMAAGGVAELVSADSGMLVEPNDADALTEGIRTIYHRDLRAMGARARSRMVAQYDWSVVMPQLLRHYASLAVGAPLGHVAAEGSYAID
ncbi:MAG: glycosyltransferase [Noviherbaspirillum sp.]